MATYMPCKFKKGKIVAGGGRTTGTCFRALKCMLFRHSADNA